MKEEWKVYKDNRIDRLGRHLGSIWEVSNYGRVKKDGELIIFNKCNNRDNCPYYKIGGFYVHRAVVELYIGKIPKGFEVEHIDGDIFNNNVNILRICTHYENMHNTVSEERFKRAFNSEDFKKKISLLNKNKVLSEETKNKISINKLEYYKTHNGYWKGKEAHNKGKKLVLCDDGKKHWT